MPREQITMRPVHMIACACIAMMQPSLSSSAHTQTPSASGYPTRPIRIVTAEAGGGGDFAARLIAQGLSTALNQQVIVDNRGITAIEIVAKAQPDGHTLLLNSGRLWIGPLLKNNIPYDVLRDFTPVTLAVSTPNVLVVHPSLAAKSVQELIALAKTRPGQLNYSTGTTGATSHLAAELFKAMAGANIVRITYKGNGPALSALLAGEVHMMFPTASGYSPHANSGKLRALAVTGSVTSALAPGLPTVSAAGLPGYESISIIGIFMPAKATSAIVSRLNEEIVRFVRLPESRERLLNAGLEPVGSTPQQLLVAVKSETTKLGKIIRDAGITGE